MNKDNLAITALIGSYDGSELEGLDPLKEGDDYFFPAIECAKRLGYHNPRDAIRRHCKRETKTVDEIVVTGNRKDGSDAVQVIHRKYICEADFYRLLFHSRTPIGERFADWQPDRFTGRRMDRSAAIDPGERILFRKEVYRPAPPELTGGKGGKRRNDHAGRGGSH